MRNLKKANSKNDIDQLKYNFFVFDTETTKLEPMPKNFVFGVLYGYGLQPKIFYTVEDFQKEFQLPKYKGKTIFAHNAEFDLLTIFGNIYTEIDNSAIFNGKFISAKYFDVTFADSMNLYPTSVEKIGKMIGSEKINNQKVKKQKLRKDNITKDDIDYCIQDCKIVFTALRRMFEIAGAIKLTIASISMFDFRSNYLKDDIFFNELVDEFYESYYGGRTEAFIIGKVNAKVYDINSMYPTVMVNTVFPDIKHLKKVTKCDVKFLKFALKYYEGLASVRVNHKDSYFGYLPVKADPLTSSGTEGNIKLLFPIGEFETVVNFNELRFAIDSGVVEILKVNYVVYGNPIKTPFKEFILDNYEKRNSSKDELNRTIYKLKMNSLYGRFAMRMKLSTTYYDEIPFQLITELKESDKYCDIKLFNEQRNDCYLITENEKFKNSFFSIPTFSSYITSAARVLLLKNLLANENNQVVYCDTDSIFLQSDFIGEIGTELGQFKLENKTIVQVNGLKNYQYIDENGELKDVIKGISKNSFKKIDKTGKIVYETAKYFKTKAALRQSKEAGESFIMKKTLTGKYDKRIILPENNFQCQTKPIKL